MRKLLPLLLLAHLNTTATTWKVGASQTYLKPSAVVNLVQDKDTIRIDAGVYLNDPVVWIKKDLVFIGLGTSTNRSIMRWNGGDIANAKGIWVFANAAITGNITIDNIVFEGARVSDGNGGNGAGVRCQAKNLAIRNCQFNSCQNGILEGGSYTGAVVSIQNTEFFNNGYEVTGNSSFSGYEHNIYISAQTDSLLVRNCYFHNPRGEANSLKTRAQKSYILYNLIDEATGQGSWEINIAQGGLNVIMGNTIIQGANSINHGIVSYDAATNVIEDFYFINNTVINKYTNTSFRYFSVTPTTGINKFKVYNNLFASVSGGNMSSFISGTLGSALDTMANRIHANYLTVGFVAPTAGNFHLMASALTAINKCVSAGNASSGYALTPLFEYQSFALPLVARVTNGGINDLGAFELSLSSAVKEHVTVATVSCYPNPAADQLTVELPYYNSTVQLLIYDMLGNEVKRTVIRQALSTINIGELKSGVYFYNVVGDGVNFSGKVVVQ